MTGALRSPIRYSHTAFGAIHRSGSRSIRNKSACATPRKVATIYNTRGDKVNDSTAKFAYSETKGQELARRLVNGSEHLGQDNIEVLANSVSASC